MMKKAIATLFLLVLSSVSIMAQIPNGYYNNASGKTGDELKFALHEIIKDHTTISYGQIWNAFWSTDNKDNGVVWDMYSDVPNGTPGYSYAINQDECDSDGCDDEGCCYNREHSWPQSWFNEQETPRTDLHHIFPTDCFVNLKRSNFPFGEVGSATWTSQNGSKLGNNTTSGYSGKVFEPIDEYKGDFARALMYMSVRYYSEDDGWGTSDMTNKSDIEPWAIQLLMRWNEQDPVSQKEINRNNVIYNDYQHNRNPFVDHPEYARRIWDPSGVEPPQPTEHEYRLVTSIDQLVAGRTYLIVNRANSKALGTTQNTNNRSAANVTIGSNAVIASIGDDVCELTLGGGTGAWTFYDATNGGYLYAASSSSNYLRTQPTNDSNGEWSIVLGTNGAATVTAQGSNTRNILKYNNQNTIFSCYGSNNTMQEICLFRRVEGGGVIEQSFELSSGWNWWTPNIDITLADFEYALQGNGIKIIDQAGHYVEYDSELGWSANNNLVLEVGNMYMVQMASAFTAVVNGTIADALDHPITLNPGSNWVGFIGTQEITLEAALSNHTPTHLDGVKTQEGSSTYLNGRGWTGRVTHLVPGKGFIYKSKAANSKTFFYPAQ